MFKCLVVVVAVLAASCASAQSLPVPDSGEEIEFKWQFVSHGVQAADDELLGAQATAHPSEQAGLAKARLLLIGLIAKMRAQMTRELNDFRAAEQAKAQAKAAKQQPKPPEVRSKPPSTK